MSEKLVVSITLTILFINTSLICFAERDSVYIEPFDNQIILSTYVANRLSSVGYGIGFSEVGQTYYPNVSTQLGLGVAWNWFAISGAVYSFKPNPEQGVTKSSDLQIHWFFSKIQLSISLQDYHGFYNDAAVENQILLRPDLRVRQYYVFSQYLFNNKKFSYRASFSLDERQLQSTGSLKAGIALYYSMITADSSLFVNSNNINRVHHENYQIVPNVGYAYTFIIKKRYYFTPDITAGLGLSFKNEDKRLKIFPLFFPRLALGYNGQNWTIGLTAQFSQSYISRVRNSYTSINSGIFQIVYTYRLPFDFKKGFKRNK